MVTDSSPSHAQILIVDDDEANCRLLRAQLGFAGFANLMVVSSGQEALDVVAQRPPDLILLDVMMPDMDGYLVTQRIRSMYPQHFIPIILLSALQETEDRVKGIQAGANDFLSRPFDINELVARINSLLALKQARDDLDAERERIALIYSISQALTAQLDYQHLMGEIATLTTDLTGAAKALLILLDEEGNFRRKILARAGEKARSVDTIDPLVLSEGLLGWVIRNRQSALVPDVSKDERWTHLPDDDEPTGSAVAVPLVQSGQVIGALLLVSPDVEAFEPEHRDLLIAIGGQAGIALENARLYEEARRQRARTESLLNQTGDPVVVTNPDGVITRINPAAERILKLDSSMLHCSLAEILDLRLSDLLLRAQERQAAVSGEFTLREQPPDNDRVFNVSVSPVEGVGYMLVWQDITALKESERVRLESERANTQRVLETFSRYMSPALVERVLSDRDILTRRERREAIVLFADLRGFTRLTVEHPADAVLELLNDVFAEMIGIIYGNEGVVFDIAGDELMVAFNVPYDQPDASRRALATAIDMQHRFTTIKANWIVRGMKVGMGIGIDRGPVVLGHVGGHSRMNYAMVGQAVNIAHRLVEVANDGQIVVTSEILQDNSSVIEGLRVRVLPPVLVKGKDQPQEMILLELPSSTKPLSV